MISRYTFEKLTWIDLESPTREEAAAVAEEFGLHPVIAGELLFRSERAKADVYDKAIYLILHFPVFNKETGHIQEVEVDFVLFKDTLITTHYELVDPLHDFAKLFEVGDYLGSTIPVPHAGFLFFFAISELYKHTLFILESTARDIRSIEKHIFGGEEAKMVVRISETNRTLIDIRQTLRYHRETLKSLTRSVKAMYGEDFVYYIATIEGQFGRIEQAAEENRQMIRDLRETNDSLLSTKTNSIIRRLTTVNVIMLPLGFIAWIFAMHSKYLLLDDPRKLIAVFGSMAVIGILSALYFRTKRWL